MIVWPASTHHATWTTHPTPDWHFALQESGYTDTEISFEWLTRIFHPQTVTRANSEARLLISDGFGTHESAEIQRFAYENNIILARLGSYTSHVCQPCDVGPFCVLKTYYRQEVEKLFRGGSKTIQKAHFTLLYNRVRQKAFKGANVRGGWKNTGLVPFNPNLVMDKIPRPELNKEDHGSTKEELINCSDFTCLQH